VLAVFTLSELGEAATVVGLWESDRETSIARRACLSGRHDSELRSFQRFMIQETSGPALLKIRHRNSDLRMLTSSKMDHDSRRGGYVENGSTKLWSAFSAFCCASALEYSTDTLAIATCTATVTDAPESALWHEAHS
jgi:hypothetical protein